MWGVEIAAVLSMECFEVGLNTIAKTLMIRGINNFVYLTYSAASGFLFLLPLAFFYHRAVTPPKLTFSILCRIFFLGFMGYLTTILALIGIGYSSPTMASAMNNLIPAYAFILARITRMEKLDLYSKSSQAKFVGTIVSVAGALIVTFYQGPSIYFVSKISSPSLHHNFHFSTQQNWVLGGFLLAASSFTVALMIIFQTSIIKDYPSEVIVALISTSSLVLSSTVVSLIVAKEPNEWKLRPDLELIAIFCSAIFIVVYRNLIISWILRKKGPVFMTMFKPLDMIIALVMGITFLGDSLYLGSAIGTMLIAFGFYSVLWGKVDEEKAIGNEETPNIYDSSCEKLPLLIKKNIKE